MTREAKKSRVASNGRPEGEDLEAIERTHLEEVARAHTALAAAQDRSYWLDRWGVDLNALMRRPGASELRAAMRLLRDGIRLAIKARRQARAKLAEVRAEALDPEAADGTPEPPRQILQRSISPKRLEAAPVTDLLFDRLEESDVQAVRERLNVNEQAILDVAEPVNRKRLTISMGLHHEVPAISERTGLTSAMPPEDVHAMARGSLAVGGAVYYGDLIVDALASAGRELEDGMRCLDFGCSSGRVVRALSAAYPGCEWHGCDPIPSAVAWAREHLPSIDFVYSPERPPLPYGGGHFDVAFAISIWSHFAEPDAVAWLAEMNRIVRPGGLLLITTHGHQTLAHDEAHSLRRTDQLEEIQTALYQHAFWFKNEFGEGGDYGVDNSGWGTAFLTPEWLLWKTAGSWRTVAYAPGRVQDNQDLYLLERR